MIRESSKDSELQGFGIIPNSCRNEPMRIVTEVRRQIDDEADFRQSDCATMRMKVDFTLEG